tara:strand:+ start:4135 stop:4317 length:183 start_codon:yes stop_codon:yes gene_type:complete
MSIDKTKMQIYHTYLNMRQDARDLSDRLKELQNINVEKTERIKEENLKRAISEERVDVWA